MNDETKASTKSNSFDFTGAAVRHVIHPLWAKLHHPAYARYLREFERNQYLHPDDLRKLQMLRLRKQLIDAYRYVPFYRYRMTEAGLTPLDIQTHEDLRLLPVLTKRNIQDHHDLLVSSNVPPASANRIRPENPPAVRCNFLSTSNVLIRAWPAPYGTTPGRACGSAIGMPNCGAPAMTLATSLIQLRSGDSNFFIETSASTPRMSQKNR